MAESAGASTFDGDAAGHDAVHHEAVAEDLGVQPQPVLLEAHELGEAEGQGGIVAERAEVAEVVGDALALQHQRPQQEGARRRRDAAGRLDGRGIGPGVGTGRIAGNAADEPRARRHVVADEQLLDALVLVAEALLEAQHPLADHREAEMARLDDAGMDGADRDLVGALAADLDEVVVARRIGKSDAHAPHGVVAQRKPVRRPGAMAQPGPLVAALGGNADQVARRALHAVGGREDAGEIGIDGMRPPAGRG